MISEIPECSYFISGSNNKLCCLCRFFLRINPEIQCRIEGLKFKKSINPSVAKLAGALTDFEAARSRWSMEGVVANV